MAFNNSILYDLEEMRILNNGFLNWLARYSVIKSRFDAMGYNEFPDTAQNELGESVDIVLDNGVTVANFKANMAALESITTAYDSNKTAIQSVMRSAGINEIR